MSSPINSPAPKSASGAPTEAVAPAPSFEDRLRTFWEKNNSLVVGVVVAILLVVVAKGAWDYFSAQRERTTQQAFGAANTTAELKSFIADHPDHILAAAARLRLADEAYTAGKYADAIADYDQAAAALKTGPFASRARLGLAIAKLLGGRAAEGEAALKTLANDETEIRPYRLEAAYHLASLAADAGRAADLKTYTDLLARLDATSPWTAQAMKLRADAK